MKLAPALTVLGAVTLAVCASIPAARAQDAGGLGAKALFYDAGGKLTGVTSEEKKPVTPKPAVTARTSLPMALRVTVLLVADSGGTREVKPSYRFKSDDRIKLAFTSNRTGYFYLATVGSSGNVQLLAPRPNEPALLERGFHYTFPAKPNAYFRFDANAGKEELWAILSDSPLKAINMGPGQVAEISTPPGPTRGSAVLASKAMSAVDLSDSLARKDLLYEEDGDAVYVAARPVATAAAKPASAPVPTAGTTKPSVVVKLTLAHD